jgi:hypothetical protein
MTTPAYASVTPLDEAEPTRATSSVTARGIPSTLPLTLTEPLPPPSVDVDPPHAAIHAALAHAIPTSRLMAVLSVLPGG